MKDPFATRKAVALRAGYAPTTAKSTKRNGIEDEEFAAAVAAELGLDLHKRSRRLLGRSLALQERAVDRAAGKDSTPEEQSRIAALAATTAEKVQAVAPEEPEEPDSSVLPRFESYRSVLCAVALKAGILLARDPEVAARAIRSADARVERHVRRLDAFWNGETEFFMFWFDPETGKLRHGMRPSDRSRREAARWPAPSDFYRGRRE